MPRLAVLLLLLLAACDGGGSIVGTWEPVGAGGGGSRTTFFADGAARIVARASGQPEQAYDARYTVQGDTLLALSDAQGTERFRFRVSADTLVLTDRLTRAETVLVRVLTLR